MLTVKEFYENKAKVVKDQESKDCDTWLRHIDRAMKNGNNIVQDSPAMSYEVERFIVQHLVEHGWCYSITKIEVGYDGGSWNTRVQWKAGPIGYWDRVNGWRDEILPQPPSRG